MAAGSSALAITLDLSRVNCCMCLISSTSLLLIGTTNHATDNNTVRRFIRYIVFASPSGTSIIPQKIPWNSPVTAFLGDLAWSGNLERGVYSLRKSRKLFILVQPIRKTPIMLG